MNRTKIEYGTHAWNPVTGCSYGCPWGCWAENVFTRHAAVKAYHGGSDFREVRLHYKRLGELMMKVKPCRVLVAFMSDLFGPEVPNDFNRRVYAAMAEAKHHAFFLLTKRAQAMKDVARDNVDVAQAPNVWHGVTITTQAEADERIPLLLATPAARRWVSAEPLLGPLDLEQCAGINDGKRAIDFLAVGSIDRPSPQFPAPKREWIESIREQCAAAGVALWEKNNLRRHGIVKDRPLVQELPA